MDTHGHRFCSTYGDKVLKASLALCGRGTWRTGAFYLGNWLTDVSQAVDPVAYGAFADKIVPLVESVVSELNSYIPFEDQRIDADFARAQAIDAAAVFRGGRSGPLAFTMKAAFKLIGYYEFVHPELNDRSPRMDFAAFSQVFDRRYTQYYPHEHLDRWEVAQKPGSDPSKVYTYLLEHIKIAAGLLAEIDHEWASKAFISTPDRCPWKSDQDSDWNMWLAKLGHALHAVEDFFSHSNFIELATQELARANKRILPKRPSFLPSTAQLVFWGRLTRYGDSGGDEDHVVTGYFDALDTLFSLSHVVEELFPGDAMPAVLTPGTRAARYLRDFLREVHTMMTASGDHALAAARRCAREVVQKRLEMTEDAFKTLLWDAAPPTIRDGFIEVVAQLSARSEGLPMSLFEAFTYWATFRDLIDYPLKFVESLLGQPLDALQRLTEPVRKQIRDAIERRLGRYRIGCHSLLAKDYLWDRSEYIDELFKQARSCSLNVHAGIINIITRWIRPAPNKVSRSALSGATSRQFNTLHHAPWVDWEYVLAYALRHPGTTAPAQGESPWWEDVINNKECTLHYRDTTETRVLALIEEAGAARTAAENAYVPGR